MVIISYQINNKSIRFMAIDSELQTRSDSKCELCSVTDPLCSYPVAPYSDESPGHNILICHACNDQLTDHDKTEVSHWRCLNDSMWSPVPAVQVVVWRMLSRLRDEGWPQDLLDMMYLEDEVMTWATLVSGDYDERATEHKDSNGTFLVAGDTVTLTKDLAVKGTSFTAKRGTAVRNISLVPNNPKQLEGRVKGTQIVILTEFVKRAS
jgi:protein PhnA